MTATLTSISAYHSIKADREAQVKQLLDLYIRHGPMSDRQASYHLGMYPSQVSARRNALIALGEVHDLGRKKDPDTGKEVSVWGIARETLF